ncbi:PRP38 family-domain-containing protein [Spinellus fusiger]|nr:PRP38 family-domain-containing protein [Spinellus fusiger]
MSSHLTPGVRLDTWGNESTMNLNAIIYQNILASPYFKSLYEKKTFHEIVDEIYNEVYNLSPFLKGTNPSTAYCCLYKLWTLRLTVKQIENLIDHVDSPYIRAVGFLYLRYVCLPAQLWDWFQYYLEDEEEIDLTSGPKPQKSTIGKLIRMLIVEQKFQGTMLPRIPVPIARDLAQKLEEHDRETRQYELTEQKQEPAKDSRREREPGRRDYRDRSHSASPRDDKRREGGRRRRNEFGEYESYKPSRREEEGRHEDSKHSHSSRHTSRYRSRSRSRSPERRHYSDRSRSSRSYSREPSRY